MATTPSDAFVESFEELERERSIPRVFTEKDKMKSNYGELQDNGEALSLFAHGSDRPKRVLALTEEGKSYTRNLQF